MFRKFLFICIICFSIGQAADGQSLVLSDYRKKCDTLQTLVRERTTVQTALRLKSVMRRNGVLDFYFSSTIGDIPWTPDDVRWLKRTLHEISPVGYSHYKIGDIYCERTPLQSMAFNAPGNNGHPAEHNWRYSGTLSEEPPLVRNADGRIYSRGLSGRHIALWQSHGRYYEAKTGRWEWQRAPLFTTVEDMYTQSYVLPFLIPMLENAGAYVMTPRERDTQKYEVIIDNDLSFPGARTGLIRRSGTYSESGRWQDAGIGFADAKEVYSGDDNPFTLGSSRKANCVPTEKGNAVASWTPDIPERGSYAVYVSYTTLPNSTSSAHYTINHLGGTSHFLVNQKMGGGTWIYLGTFEFEDGRDCRVTLDNGTYGNASFERGTAVTADAVKIGGGMGKIARGNDDVPVEKWTVSGLPSFTEGALYWMQWAGADSTVIRRYDNDYTNDYGDRGAWVTMMSGGSKMAPKVEGKGIPFDLSFAFHTDAGVMPGDTTVGTLSIYTLISEGSRKYADGEDRILGRILANDIQSQIVADVRRQYEPDWNRRQLANRSYSEARTPSVPAALLELLSHQNFADMKYGLDPAFRFTVSRAVYKGMLKFLSGRYGVRYCVQPLPVHSFSATLTGEGKVQLSWRPTLDSLELTAMPERYMLYTRIDDGAFDNGELLTGLRHEDGRLTIDRNIDKGHIYSYRIVACNEGGRSFPSETLSVGEVECSPHTVLVVNNFDRVAPPAWFDTPTYAGFDERLDAGVPYMYEINRIGEMYQYRRDLQWLDDDNPGFGASYTDNAGKLVPGNTFDFTTIHGKSLMAAGYSFCSSSVNAFETDSLRLHSFWTTDILCGKQASTPAGRGVIQKSRFQVMPEALQKAIRSCTGKGGNILISGANIGTDLWDQIYPVGRDSLYQAGAQEFVKEVLGYKWLTNYASRCEEVRPMPGKIMQMTDFCAPFAFYQKPNDYIYNVETPDGLQPASDNAFEFLRYIDTNISAGVCNVGNGYRSASIGFPIEVIKDEQDRVALLKAVLDFFSTTKH